MTFYYTYILLSEKDDKFYIGFTSNMKQRIEDHSSGKVSSTKSRRPLKLVYFEGHLSKYDALRREKYFKTSAGKKSLRLMIRDSLDNLTSI